MPGPGSSSVAGPGHGAAAGGPERRRPCNAPARASGRRTQRRPWRSRRSGYCLVPLPQRPGGRLARTDSLPVSDDSNPHPRRPQPGTPLSHPRVAHWRAPCQAFSGCRSKRTLPQAPSRVVFGDYEDYTVDRYFNCGKFQQQLPVLSTPMARLRRARPQRARRQSIREGSPQRTVQELPKTYVHRRLPQR